MKNELTAEYLHSILDYNPETGEFRWKVRSNVPPECNTRWAGKIAGRMQKKGYWEIKVNAILYQAHRLAWLYVTGENPTHEIDHRDLNRCNNIFKNLREATHAQNAWNTGKRSNNISGYKGVGLYKGKHWRARITINNKELYLGYFDTPELAHTAYCEAAIKYHAQFARGA